MANRTVFYGLGAVYLQIKSQDLAMVRLWESCFSNSFDLDNAFEFDTTKSVSAKLSNTAVVAVFEDIMTSVSKKMLPSGRIIGELYLSEHTWAGLLPGQQITRPHVVDRKDDFQYQAVVDWVGGVRYHGFRARVVEKANASGESELLVEHYDEGSWKKKVILLALNDASHADSHLSSGGLTAIQDGDASVGAVYISYAKITELGLGIPKLPPGFNG